MGEGSYHVDVDDDDGDEDRCRGLHVDGVDGDGFSIMNSPLRMPLGG